MATTDEDLSQLEKDIRQLKIEYEQYFGGGRSRPPADIEWRIEQIIKKYGERGGNMTFGQRFRYSGLAQTHARFREVFRKRLKQKEEGTVVRHFGAAAKAIEAERKGSKKAPRVAEGSRTSVLLSEPEREMAKARKLYEAFRSAKEEAGENTQKLTPDAFQEFLQRKATELRAKNGDKKIEFVVNIENGKVQLKARLKEPVKSKV
jgi:hypothetical protein